MQLRLTWALGWKNLRVKYKNALFGFFWSLLNPLLFLLIFAFIFGNVFNDIQNYRLYALSGLVIWSFFPVASNQVIQSLVENAPVLKSLHIVPGVFTTAALLSSIMNFGITLIPFTILMFVLDFKPSAAVLLLPFLLLAYFIFVYGFSVLLGGLNIYFRDIGLLWNTLLPALFYFTPIAYPPSLVPATYRWIIELNPLFHFVEMFRMILYAGEIPPGESWVKITIIAGLMYMIGVSVFKKLQKGFYAYY